MWLKMHTSKCITLRKAISFIRRIQGTFNTFSNSVSTPSLSLENLKLRLLWTLKAITNAYPWKKTTLISSDTQSLFLKNIQVFDFFFLLVQEVSPAYLIQPFYLAMALLHPSVIFLNFISFSKCVHRKKCMRHKYKLQRCIVRKVTQA